jgi:hypothetical protein
MSPGDVIFVHKYPPGFHRGMNYEAYNSFGALSTFHAANGTQTVSRVYGLDGVNRLLHPAGPDGAVLGRNVLRLGKQTHKEDHAWPETPAGMTDDQMGIWAPHCFADVVLPAITEDEVWRTVGAELDPLSNAKAQYDAQSTIRAAFKNEWKDKRFRLQTLNEITLDGVCQSNDAEYAFNGSGQRDGTILNLVIQGPAMVNNGYCAYDGGEPNDRHANTEEQALDTNTKRPSKNPHMSRTIEKHARGSIEAQNHVFASGRVTLDVVDNKLTGTGVPKIGSPWLPNGVFDFIASFTGQYSSYPVRLLPVRAL